MIPSCVHGGELLPSMRVISNYGVTLSVPVMGA